MTGPPAPADVVAATKIENGRPELDQLRAAALRYAAAGWPVFPCRPGRKEPLTRHGFKDATTDPGQICRWWCGPGLFNVAIATGEPGPDALDIDNKAGGSGWAAFNRLIAAGMVKDAFALIRTRSGGLHVYFSGSGQGIAKRIGGFDLDFRGAGGYVVAPPSWVNADGNGPAGAYAVLEFRPYTGAMFDLSAATALLAAPKPARRTPIARSAPAASDGNRLTNAARAGICRVVIESNKGGSWAGALFWAGCRYGEAAVPLADALAELVDAAQPWNERETSRAEMHVRNGWHRGRQGAS